MDEGLERDLLAMLVEPTADKVRRDQISADMVMRSIGRALAPIVNAKLAELASDIAQKEPD